MFSKDKIFTVDDIFIIYRLYANLGIVSKSLIEKFEKFLLGKLSINKLNLASNKRFSSLSDEKIYSNLLSIWKIQSRYNETLMEKYVLTAIKNKLQMSSSELNKKNFKSKK